MRKRALALTLALCMVVGTVTGCGGDKKSSGNEEVKIQFMHQEVEQERQDAIQKIIDEFEAENPNIKVEQVPVNEDDYDTKITTLGGNGDLPAVIEFSQDQAKTSVKNQFIDTEACKEVIESAGNDAYFDGPLSVTKTEDGSAYVGVPICGWVQGIWCNTAMLSEKGFDVPTNWDEVLEIAKAFYDPDNKKYGISLPTGDVAFTEQVFSQFALSNNANIFDADKNVKVDTAEIKEAVEFYNELASYSMPGSTEVADVKEAFVGQNAPMCMYSTYIMKACNEAGFLDSVDLVLPTNKVAASYGCIYVLSIAEGLSDSEKDAAKKFTQFLLETEHNEEWLTMAPGGVQPVLKAVADDPNYANNEVIKPFAHVLPGIKEAFDNIQLFGCVDGKNFMVMGDVTNSGILSKMLNNIIVQGADVDSEIKNAQSKIEELVK